MVLGEHEVIIYEGIFIRGCISGVSCVAVKLTF